VSGYGVPELAAGIGADDMAGAGAAVRSGAWLCGAAGVGVANGGVGIGWFVACTIG